ncbi:putative lipoprotein lppS [Mycobacteroides abscessus subsp. massiliense]|nr:putative lipoprotein lppS [Mycobacteroides abscessus subsp. massiliense]
MEDLSSLGARNENCNRGDRPGASVEVVVRHREPVQSWLISCTKIQREQSMTQGRPRLHAGARRRWAATLALPVVAMAVLAGCAGATTQEPPKVIDKATPYADLLVPKLAMSVKP